MLEETTWYKEDESGNRDMIQFRTPEFQDHNGNYISFYNNVWYTEGPRLILVGLLWEDIADPETPGKLVPGDLIVWETVELEYSITTVNGVKTLRLRPVGSTEWDEWTSEDYYYYSQSKAKAHTDKRTVSPFRAFRR